MQGIDTALKTKLSNDEKKLLSDVQEVIKTADYFTQPLKTYTGTEEPKLFDYTDDMKKTDKILSRPVIKETSSKSDSASTSVLSIIALALGSFGVVSLLLSFPDKIGYFFDALKTIAGAFAAIQPAGWAVTALSIPVVWFVRGKSFDGNKIPFHKTVGKEQIHLHWKKLLQSV